MDDNDAPIPPPFAINNEKNYKTFDIKVGENEYQLKLEYDITYIKFNLTQLKPMSYKTYTTKLDCKELLSKLNLNPEDFPTAYKIAVAFEKCALNKALTVNKINEENFEVKANFDGRKEESALILGKKTMDSTEMIDFLYEKTKKFDAERAGDFDEVSKMLETMEKLAKI